MIGRGNQHQGIGMLGINGKRRCAYGRSSVAGHWLDQHGLRQDIEGRELLKHNETEISTGDHRWCFKPVSLQPFGRGLKQADFAG